MSKMRLALMILALQGLLPADAGARQAAEKTTDMGKLAASMAPGTWAELKTKNIVETLGSDGADGSIFGYSEDGAWDPTSRQWLYIGGDHNGIAEFVSYSADTNSWKRLPRPAWIGTVKGLHTMHGYDHNAINPATGDFFHRSFGGKAVHRYQIASGKWTDLPPIPADEYLADTLGVEYFPELGGLFVVNDAGGSGSAYLFSEKENKWRTLATKLPMGHLNTFAEYSPLHKVMIFGGGNNSKDLYKADASGKVTTLKKAPEPLGIRQSIVTVDPVGGDFLVFMRSGAFYVYDVLTDTWKLQSGAAPIFNPAKYEDNKIWDVDATPVSTYGVTMFVKYSPGQKSQAWVYLYKHSARAAAKK